MVKTLHLKIVFLLALWLMVSCGSPTPRAMPPVSDQEVEAAVKQAHQTMGTLLGALLSPDPTNRFIGVKARFMRKDVASEDHWTEPLDYYNDVFTVKLLDGLTFDNGLHAEHAVEVPSKDILDWMIVKSDGELIGGYTIRLAYEHMTPAEKEDFLKNTGYKIN